MRITRITRIKDHRVFRDFSWPATLEDFAQFNLIYGWNGSGKTTLSNLFRAIEKKEAVTEGEAEFCVDGKSCPGATLDSNLAIPRVRVFNRAYIEASVFRPSDELEPILVLGEDSVEKQKEIDKLRKQVERERSSLATCQQTKGTAERALETFNTDNAAIIKNLIGNDAASTYRNYHKGKFREKADELLNDIFAESRIVTDNAKQKLILRQQERPKDKINEHCVSLKSFSGMEAEAATLLSMTVIAQTLQHLVEHPDVSEWVGEGLKFHPAGASTCEFCDQPLPKDRLAILEGHFNDQLKAHTASLDGLLARIDNDDTALEKLRTSSRAELYADLATEYEASQKTLEAAIASRRQALARLSTAVEEKRGKPFERVDLTTNPNAEDRDSVHAVSRMGETEGTLPSPQESDPVDAALTCLNAVVSRHNKQTDDFPERIDDARKTLEDHCVAKVLPDYKDRQKAVTDAETECTRLATLISGIDATIAKLDREISEHVRPAEELTRELRSYLGRDELTLKAAKNGYTITRHGFPATNLSESEKTAIAFLHFLKSLESNAGERAFDSKNGIVVIDDPVSSLDASALFYAFAFLKERTKEIGQLFVLTHNFTFFSLVRKWFNFLNKSQRGYFMLDVRSSPVGRAATIAKLDASLERSHSEYHFLFSRIYSEAHKKAPPAELADLYPFPNMARRFLESFLAFRRPSLLPDREKSELHDKIRDVAPAFDSVKKARILRFVQTFSHDNKIPEEEHDLFLLGEARDVLEDILALVECEDPEHYKGMLKTISL